MDVKSFASEAAQQEEGRTYEVENADGEVYLRADGQPQTITVLGVYAPAIRRVQEANMQRSTKGLRFKLDAAVTLANRIRVAQAGIKAWTLELEGQAVPLNPENVASIMRAAPWILDQNDTAMRASKDFFSKPSAS